MDERLLAIDEDIEYISDRIAQLPSSVDSDTEYHERCVALADAAEGDEARGESLRCGGCQALHRRLELLSAALRRVVFSGSHLLSQREGDVFL